MTHSSAKLTQIVNYSNTLNKLGSLKRHPDYSVLVEATSFLDQGSSVSQRLWHVKNNVYHIPVCAQCGVNPVSWRKETGGFYSVTCSNSCATKSVDRLQKIQSTNLKKYGCVSPLGNTDVQLKRTDTVRSKYGVDNVSQIQAVKDKVSHNLFTQRNRHSGSKQFVSELISHHNTQREIGDVLGISQPRVSSLLWRFGVQTERSSSSTHQRELTRFVTEDLGLDVDENNSSIIHPHHIDIVIPSKRVGIELNGIFWHSEISGRNRSYHLNKTVQANNNGIKLLHFYDTECAKKLPIVKSIIRNACGSVSNRVGARSTKVIVLSISEEREFFNSNHMQGYVPSSVCYGLVYNNTIVAAMSMGSSRYTTDTAELLRYAVALNTAVVGGASKLFKHCLHIHKYTTIVSYHDRRWFMGDMYGKLGFDFVRYTQPGYSYFRRSGDTTKLMSRIRFQKHKLQGVLDTFDPNKTEWENMQSNGYDRVWDCGNGKWIWSVEKQKAP